MSEHVHTKEEWLLGPENTPFFTKTWSPVSGQVSACAVFVHGFSEHIARYDDMFMRLAAPPHNLHIFAYDQRGHGRTSIQPLTSTSPEVQTWQKQGGKVNLEKNGKRRTGGWARVMPDMEWFVKHQSGVAKGLGKRLFLWGFSMGGGQVIGFCTRPSAPPSKETIGLLAGVIAGGPLIKLSKPAPWIQQKTGSLAANLGLGSFLIPTSIDYSHLSHNKEANEKNKNDPLCEQLGSLRGVADMLNLGALLLSSESLSKFPKDLPLLVYHGDEDKICSIDASREFVERCQVKDKTHHAFKGMYHEVHNELEPTPTEVAALIGNWIYERAGGPIPPAEATVKGQEQASTDGGVSKL